MNNKGNIAVAAAILVTAIVGVLIVDQVSLPMWSATAVTNEAISGLVYNGTTDSLANGCAVTAANFYDTTNGTAVTTDNYTLTPATYPSKTTTYTVTWTSANFLHNGTNMTTNYTYGCEKMTGATERLIMEYFAVLVGIMLLVIAGGWLYLKGGM